MTLAVPFRKLGTRTAMATATIPLVQAAKEIGASYSVLRRALIRVGFLEHQADGPRVIDVRIAKLFAHYRRTCGYLYPRSANSRAKLLAAASKLPEGPK
jgi:hypothetical protein